MSISTVGAVSSAQLQPLIAPGPPPGPPPVPPPAPPDDSGGAQLDTPRSTVALPPPPPDSAPPPPPPPPPLSSAGGSTGLLGDSLTADQQSSLETLGELLDTDAQALLEKLQSGSTLAELLQGSGIDPSTLASVIQDGLLFDTRI